MGHVHIIRDFASPQEGLSRTVRIYTPDAYDHESHRRFPVLYMQDGQNVFAHPESSIYDTWCANTARGEQERPERERVLRVGHACHGAG
jgi:predicted alpha/beta superfamily hydrolase